jgi:hypothetical protein
MYLAVSRTYQIKVKDANSCVSAVTVTIHALPPLPESAAGATMVLDLSCATATDANSHRNWWNWTQYSKDNGLNFQFQIYSAVLPPNLPN